MDHPIDGGRGSHGVLEDVTGQAKLTSCGRVKNRQW